MSRYLLDTGVLTAYLKGRPGAVALVDPWVHADEATTSIVVYGEAVEYLQGLSDPDYARHLGMLRGLMTQIHPYPLTFVILERYASLRRATPRATAATRSRADWRYRYTSRRHRPGTWRYARHDR